MQISDDQQALDPVHYVRVLRRYWPIIALVVAACALLGYLATPDPPSTGGRRFYRATHNLILTETPEGRPDGVLQQAALIATTGDVPQRVAGELGLEIDYLTSRLQAESRVDLLAVLLTGVSTDPTEAELIADTAASSLLTVLTEDATTAQTTARDTAIRRAEELDEHVRFLDQEIANATNPTDADLIRAERDATLSELFVQRETMQRLSADGVPSARFRSVENAVAVEISRDAYRDRRDLIQAGVQPIKTGAAANEGPRIESVEAPGTPANPLSFAAIGGILGLMLGVGLAFLLNRLDLRIRDRDDAENSFGLQVISEIPSFTNDQRDGDEVLCHTDPRSQLAEAHRLIRTSVLYLGTEASTDENGRRSTPVVLITSPSPEDGKTTTVVNLAAVLAETGMSVLVVNCDFRRPRIHRFLRSDSAAVIHDTDDLQFVQTGIPGVRMVTNVKVGPETNPADVIARQRDVIQAAQGRFDVILLDTAPFLTTNDAAELLPEADMVLVVAQVGKTRRDAAKRTAELLGRLGANVAGVVLTNSPYAAQSDYYYYYLSDSGDGSRSRRRRKHQERAEQATLSSAKHTAAQQSA